MAKEVAALKYRLPITVVPLGEGGYMAHCDPVRATATGNTSEEAIENLCEAIKELVVEFGEAAVFQDIKPEAEVQVLEVSL